MSNPVSEIIIVLVRTRISMRRQGNGDSGDSVISIESRVQGVFYQNKNKD